MSGNFRRFFVKLSYIGSNYRGSQKQASGNIIDLDSVQGTIESAFFKYAPKLVKPPIFVFAGRTDAGVHALSTTAHVDLELADDGVINKEHMLKMMNRYLINCNHQIRIHEFYQVSEKFHARYHAKNRIYMYRFLVPKEPNFYQVPIIEMDRSKHVNYDHFDLDKFKAGLKLFNGTYDFTTFSSKSFNKVYHENNYFKSYIRTMSCYVEEALPLLPSDPLSDRFKYYHVFFSSKGFLYKQIRKIMGTLFHFTQNKVSEKDVLVMLQVPNRILYQGIPTVPHGLYLKEVQYDKNDVKEIFDD